MSCTCLHCDGWASQAPRRTFQEALCRHGLSRQNCRDHLPRYESQVFSKRLLLSHKRDTGPWLLCSAKILRGRKITCFHAIKVRLIRTNTQLAVARHHNAPTPPGRRGKRWSGVGRSRSRRRQEPHHVTHPQRPAGWLRALTVLYFLSHHLHRELVSQAFCKAIIECATIGVGGVSA